MRRLLFVLVIALFLMIGCEDKSTESDTTNPEVVITYPADGVSVAEGQIITIIAEATDNSNVEKVEFLINGQVENTDNESPYQYAWDTSSKSGSNTILAKAYDTAGNTGLSEVVNVIVISGSDNNPPTMPSDPNPANGSSNVSVDTNLSWYCSDPDGNALTYDVYFDTSPNPQLVNSDQNNASYDPGVMNYDTAYYWKILASDGEFETSSPVWNFTTSLTQTVATPTFNPPGGTYTSDQNVTISCSTSGATIYYSIDSSTPSIPYSDPISISASTILKSRATKTGWTDSQTASTTYIIYVSGEMIFVQGGTYEMGDHFNEGEANEFPVHEVTISSFFIGQYEVTQGEYEAVMGSNPASGYGVGDNYPVYYETWYDAVEYCNALSVQESLTPCYNLSDWSCDFNADGYRLPTEAEWEYADRGGVNWTDNYRYSGTTDNLGDYAVYDANDPGGTTEVGSKLPNQLGIYDMSGNVWEWCWDWYSSSYYSNSPINNPTGPESSSNRVGRGGGWVNDAACCRVADRSYDNPSYGSGNCIGFRILRAAE